MLPHVLIDPLLQALPRVNRTMVPGFWRDQPVGVLAYADDIVLACVSQRTGPKLHRMHTATAWLEQHGMQIHAWEKSAGQDYCLW